MPLGRETIGVAYVRILADGTGFANSVDDELHDADDDFEAAGEEHSKRYTKGWEKERKANKSISKSLEKDLDFALGRIEQRAEFAGGDIEARLTRHFQNSLRNGLDPKVADEAAKRAARSIMSDFESGLDFDVSFRNINRAWNKALADMHTEESNFERDHRRIMEESAKVSRAAATEMDRSLHIAAKAVDDWDLSLSRAAASQVRMGQGFKDVDRNGRPLFKTLDHIGDSLGTAFGAGARNNFVNLVGIVVGGMAKIATSLIKGTVLLTDWVRGVEDAGKTAEKFASTQAATALAMEEAGAEVAATGPPGWLAVAAAIAAIAFIAPVAVSAISALAAAVTAVASSMAFAVAGGVGVFAGLLLPMVGALGVLLLSFNRIDNALKGATGFKELGNQFSDLRDDAAEGIAKGITDSLPELRSGLKTISPLVRDISDALGDVIGRFAAIADSPAFRFFIATMGQLLPEAVRRLGSATAAFAEGMLNIFGVLGEPGGPVDRFLGWIGQVADEFDRWSSSKQGRAEIREFFERATTSAQAWWDLLKSVGGTLQRVFFSDAGRRAGDSIVGQVADAFDRLNTWLDQHPEAISQWFEDGKQIATQVGRAIGGIIKVFDTLDTPENRRAAEVVIGAIALHLRIVNKVLQIAGAAFHTFNHVVKAALAATALTFANWAGDVIGLALRAFSWVPGVKDKLNAAAVQVEAFKSRMNASLHGIDNHVEIRITADARDAIADTARLQAQLNGIPSSVTTSLIVKMTKQIGTAAGGVFVGAQTRIIGEAGPEAVVPLNRPLSQVDPAVRELSAIAQGKTTITNNNTNQNGRSAQIGPITIITPTKDPVAVARETVNRMVAAAYI